MSVDPDKLSSFFRDLFKRPTYRMSLFGLYNIDRNGDIEEIKNEISTINPDYIFEFANLHESGKDDVLIAYIQGE